MPPDPPVDVDQLLSASHLFAGLDPDERDAIARELHWVRLAGGEELFSAGDPAHSVYTVVTGRVAVERDGADPLEIGAGEPVGELGLLTGSPRSATVRAVRDTVLAELSQEAFRRLVESHADAGLALLRLIAERQAAPPSRRRSPAVRTVAVCAMTPGSRVDRFAADLASVIPHVRLVRAAALGVDAPASIGRLVDDAERAGATTVLDATDAPPGWRPACIHQADRVLFVADANAAVSSIAELPSRSVAARELVLLHDASSPRPAGTAGWLRATGAARHWHIRDKQSADLERLGRSIRGCSIGLALSGGGGRAFAHIGAIRALREAAVPIDIVAGSSIGAVVAAQIASGLDPDEILKANDGAWNRVHPQRHLTLPVLALVSTRTTRRLFDRLFGDWQLEDCWLPCIVTTVDLKTYALRPMSRGPLARLTLASSSPPALWPPVVHEGTLLVDGGLLDNLPVESLRAAGAAHVIAVNTTRRDELDLGGVAETPSAWRFAARRLPGRHAGSFPNIGGIVTAELDGDEPASPGGQRSRAARSSSNPTSARSG